MTYRVLLKAYAPQAELLLDGLRAVKEQLSQTCSVIDKPGWLLAGCNNVLVKVVLEIKARELPRITPEAAIIISLDATDPSILIEKAREITIALSNKGIAVTLET